MKFLPTQSGRSADKKNIGRESYEIANDEFLRQFIRSLPYVTAILDKNRKIVLSNNVTLEGEYDFMVEEFFGREPGEALNCIHYRKPYGSCDGMGVCQYCGMPNAIIRAEKTGEKATQETSITIRLPNKTEKTYDIIITSAPFLYNNQQFLMLTINDLSEQKRKRALERIFFHDILNKTGSLTSVYELLRNNNFKENKEELLELSEEIVKDMNEEILLQKNLVAAESGDLEIKQKNIATKKIIEDSIKQVIQYPESQDINIELDENVVNEQFTSDPIILKRILINMLKNAVEASRNHQKVIIGCKKKKDKVVFWVHNYAFIPRESQIKIFDRTFSTKSEDRGLGTYSMKLLGEKYLGGKVYFATDSKKGTTFYFEVPS